MGPKCDMRQSLTPPPSQCLCEGCLHKSIHGSANESIVTFCKENKNIKTCELSTCDFDSGRQTGGCGGWKPSCFSPGKGRGRGSAGHHCPGTVPFSTTTSHLGEGNVMAGLLAEPSPRGFQVRKALPRRYAVSICSVTATPSTLRP